MKVHLKVTHHRDTAEGRPDRKRRKERDIRDIRIKQATDIMVESFSPLAKSFHKRKSVAKEKLLNWFGSERRRNRDERRRGAAAPGGA